MHEENSDLRVRASTLSRRAFITFMAGGLAACQQTRGVAPPSAALPLSGPLYPAMPNERFPIPAVAGNAIPADFTRQQVAYSTQEPAGTIVVDPAARFLYLVQEDGTALRYGIGVGREGFGWSGAAIIAFKREWPRWTPPAEMIQRQPELEPYRNGMEPGLANPLGARALYLFQNGRDTLYRLHGTNEPASIGRNVSSGCIRLINQEIIDLYDRTPSGTRVVVLNSAGPTA